MPCLPSSARSTALRRRNASECVTSAADRSTARWIWLRERRAKLSGKSETAKAIDYSLKRWPAFTRFLDDGRLCMSNNAAERAVRCVAMTDSFCTSSSSVWKH
jgi:hypothetical protein